MKDHFRFESLPLFVETLKTVICFSHFFASPSSSATTVDESSTGFWSKVFPSPLNWKNKKTFSTFGLLPSSEPG